jgi:hypothetical protein
MAFPAVDVDARRVFGRAGDTAAVSESYLVLASDLGVGDRGIGHGHVGAAVAKDGHNGLNPFL